ncbi:MAG: TMEM175 family protein [Thermoleophilaceae bacterium]
MTKSRVEAFSDGVFAIAITLLVLEIKVPKAGEHTLWHDLGNLWPSFAAFVVSFFTIGVIWVNHHALYDRIRTSTRTLLFLNLFLLLWVSFIPFPTALVAEHLRDGTSASQHTAAAFYATTFLLMGLSFFAVYLYAGRRRLLIEELTPEQVRALLRRNAVGQFGYAAAVAVSFLSAGAALAITAAVAAYYVHPGRLGQSLR